MLPLMDPAIILGAVVGLIGPSGIVWFALRFNREDARAAVGTMKEVSSELRLELQRAYDKNESLETEVKALRLECGKLRQEVTLLRKSNEARHDAV